jgi:ATP-dependent Clp protease, protease subunit
MSVKHNTNLKSLYIIGDVNQDLLFSFMPKFFHIEEACKRDGVDTMTIHMSTNGGNIEPGLAIYDIIKNSPIKTKIICHGYVYSCGTVILQAGEERIAMPNATFLLHPISCSVEDTEFNVKNWMSALETMSKRIYSILSDRGLSTVAVHKMEREDMYLSAYEALGYGLIDKIFQA